METITFNGREYTKIGTLPVGENTARYVREMLAVKGKRGAFGVINTRINGTRFIQWASNGRTQEEQ